MKMYWVYDLPNWLFGSLTLVVFVAFGLVGLYLTRGWVRRLHQGDHAYNDIVGFYMAGVTVLYGVSVGLLAIGAWATYADVQGKIDHEAAALGALYRDIGAYPEPARTPLCKKTCASTFARLSTWDGHCNSTESFPITRARC